jgi:serine/threonine-protein kinase
VRRLLLSSALPARVKRELFEKAARSQPEAPLEVRAKRAFHASAAFEALVLLEELSAHRAARGDADGAVSALRHALDRARQEMYRGELDDPIRAVLVFSRKLAEALAARESFADAEGVLREALGMAPPASSDRAHLLAALAYVAHARQNRGDATKYLAEALTAARQSDVPELVTSLEELQKSMAVA